MSDKIYTNKYFDTVKGLTKESEQKWKFNKIRPLIDHFIRSINKDRVSIIDIGAGSSLILKLIDKNYSGINIEKTVLEVNQDARKYLSKHNPDANLIISDISKNTSIKDKEHDLSMMIDVIEHIDDYESALKETSRISKYCIIKVPIERTVLLKIYNILTMGKYRKKMVEEIGHVNVWSKPELVRLISKNMGDIVMCNYANIPQYMLSKNWKNGSVFNTIFYLLSSICYKISPNINQKFFNDHLLVLVKCKQ